MNSQNKIITVVSPCYNEEGNVRELYDRVRGAILAAGDYRYEHIFIDNASRDTTLQEGYPAGRLHPDVDRL